LIFPRIAPLTRPVLDLKRRALAASVSWITLAAVDWASTSGHWPGTRWSGGWRGRPSRKDRRESARPMRAWRSDRHRRSGVPPPQQSQV